jgi:uncharacterized protein (TIGR03118 family)
MSVRASSARLGASRWLILATLIGLLALQVGYSKVARADEGSSFVQTNLVSDVPGMAKFLDANLVNPWGLVHGPTTPWWVADNNGNVSTLYDGDGNIIPLVVKIPTPTAATGGTPTGTVFYSGKSTDFVVTDGTASGPSRFLFATEDGTIVGWSPTVNTYQAFVAVDNSQVPDAANGAVYKGLAIAKTEEGPQLYAANFRAGTVDVYDSQFKKVEEPGAFKDSKIPAGYAPFGIQEIGGRIFVSYAVQKLPDRHDDMSGPGNGFVDVYSTEGKLLKRLIKQGALNSPWGMARAPEGFGEHGEALLVGNFGDGRINAYDIKSGELEGPLRRPDGSAVEISGLWGIAFGNGAKAGPKTTLFFAAGINEEKNGLFGSLVASPGGHGD